MRRTGVPIVALLLLTGSTGAFALQTPGNKLTAAQIAGQVVHAKPDIAKIAGVYTSPLKQVCVEGPCNDTSPTTNQTNASGTEPTNAATNTVTPPGATNTTTNDAATNNEENATQVIAENNGTTIVVPPLPPQSNYWPLIAATGAIVLLAAAAGIGLYRHNILVKTRELLSLRTTLAQPRMPSTDPSMHLASPPLSIRTRVEEGVTEYG